MTTSIKKQGLLLVNLGTPDAAEPAAVGRYLREFLMDPYVIDIPLPLRWFLVNVLIVPRRKHASAHAYQSVWTERGSPLLTHLLDLKEAVQAKNQTFRAVSAGMRYGRPSLATAFDELLKAGCDQIIVFPLYPQYAESTTRSSRQAIESVARLRGFSLENLKFIDDYHSHPAFVDSFAQRFRETFAAESSARKVDHVLFSYHGLPKRQILRIKSTEGYCFENSMHCCDEIRAENRQCYRAHCFASSRSIASRLGLDANDWSVSFQSRLGRTEWIRPYTDEVIPDLARRGVRHLAVLCPSFTADCLETIEEMGMRGRELFLQAGGEKFTLVPCLNSHSMWVDGVLAIASK